MKKFFTLCLLSLLFVGLLFAKEKSPVSFNFENGLGMSHSFVNESVLQNDVTISDLDWKTILLPNVNMGFQFSYRWFSFGANFNSAIPVKTGSIEDFDCLATNSNDITNFSKHDLYVDKDYKVEAYLQFSFLWGNRFSKISSFVGCGFKNKKYSARDGFLQYPEVSGNLWTGNEPKVDVTGNVISYEQSYFYPFFGVVYSQDFDILYWSFSFAYYPYISAKALDSHYLRLTQFYDSMNNGSGSLSLLSVGYFPESWNYLHGFMLTFSFQNVFSQGKSSSNNIGIKKSEFTTSPNVTASVLDSQIYLSLSYVRKYNF